jgi:hypothetical protein
MRARLSDRHVQGQRPGCGQQERRAYHIAPERMLPKSSEARAVHVTAQRTRSRGREDSGTREMFVRRRETKPPSPGHQNKNII